MKLGIKGAKFKHRDSYLHHVNTKHPEVNSWYGRIIPGPTPSVDATESVNVRPKVIKVGRPSKKIGKGKPGPGRPKKYLPKNN